MTTPRALPEEIENAVWDILEGLTDERLDFNGQQKLVRDNILEVVKTVQAQQEAYEQGRREICICAAVKTTKGYIVRGHRHADCIQSIRRMGLKPSSSPSAQGFITSKNRYVTREQGRKLQEDAGIPSADKNGYMGSKELFSEDLYRDFEALSQPTEERKSK